MASCAFAVSNGAGETVKPGGTMRLSCGERGGRMTPTAKAPALLYCGWLAVRTPPGLSATLPYEGRARTTVAPNGDAARCSGSPPRAGEGPGERVARHQLPLTTT